MTVVSYPEEVPLGLYFEVEVEARNVSGQPVTVAFGEAEPPVSLEIVGDDGRAVDRCPELESSIYRIAKLSEVPAGWVWRRGLAVCLKAPGSFEARAVMRSSWAALAPNAEGPAPWAGATVSPTFTFRIVEPEGADREAYQAFLGEPLPILDGEGVRAQLLRRFPSSTYAAYVVWEFGAKGLASMPVARITDYLKMGVAKLGNSVPDPFETWRSYSGGAFVRWREGWFDQVLKAHPAIWFGDELRFTSALDAHFLGDKASCAAQLRDLAEHGRPYVAEKAGELLAAMQAKGMLEEKAK